MSESSNRSSRPRSFSGLSLGRSLLTNNGLSLSLGSSWGDDLSPRSLFFWEARGAQWHRCRQGLTSQIYPIPFVSRSLDWLAWLGWARLASAWLVSSAAATRTATTPEQASTTIAAARSAAPVVLYACSGVVAVLVAAAAETCHAEARRAKSSQAIQSRDRFTNGIGHIP